MASEPPASADQPVSAGATRLAGVLETCLYATDLDRSARFYEEVLGLSPFARAEGRHVFFHAGNAVFLLFQPAATALGSGVVPPHGATGPGHVAFAASEAELDEWANRLDDLGVEIEADLRWPAGGRSLYIRDPAGNSVEIATPKIWSLPDPRSGVKE